MAIELRDDAANGVNEDGSTWCVRRARVARRGRVLLGFSRGALPSPARANHPRWRKSGEDVGEGGYRCRWTVMGGAARDGSWEYKETVRRVAPA